ncbi:hypothetical protein PGC35_19600 [Psychrobacillus sp. PGGUH221]|uniref:hypothetical protein n=1 Tax=Psychrobacillus sp. PGGUH221 TaxID=3020058 RepID=UPI0035C71C9A
MKTKHILMVATIFVSTFAISPASFTQAQENTSKDEVWVDYDYNDIKDLPSKVTMDLTNPDEISTRDTTILPFGEGLTYLNRDGLEWYGTHATSVKNGKAIFYFAVQGELLKKPKGSTSLNRLDQDSDTVHATNDGLVLVTTRGNTGIVGDTMIAKSSHQVNLGWSVTNRDTIEQVEL